MEQPDDFYGQMNDPTAAARLAGPCGDSMEFYLYIREGNIEQVRYYTEGCESTRRCGRAVAARAEGRSIIDALAINPAEIINEGDCVPEDGKHCAILAVSTLYRAVADYMLQA